MPLRRKVSPPELGSCRQGPIVSGLAIVAGDRRPSRSAFKAPNSECHRLGRRQGGINQHALLDQLQPLQTRMPVLAHDDVVVHGNAERGRDLDDRLGHLDIGLRRRRVAASERARS